MEHTQWRRIPCKGIICNAMKRNGSSHETLGWDGTDGCHSNCKVRGVSNLSLMLGVDASLVTRG
eukprot:scaffold51410_cov36-Prasinocladus_malaysianus.AAC.1